MYKKDNVLKEINQENKDYLTEILKEGARRLLKEAINNEVEEWINYFMNLKDDNGKQRIVRNGYQPERDIITGIGSLKIKKPRVRDRKKQMKFTSKILPRYMKRIPNIENTISTLYLKGISTNDFSIALQAILGENAKGLSATNIVRLKKQWEEEYKEWTKRKLSDKEYIYFWVDGIYFNVRMESIENKKQCILVVIGVTENGEKEIVSITDGYSESEESWRTVFKDLKIRGLKNSPKLIIGDGNLGTWTAASKEFPDSKQQLCWFHKIKNVLNKMPKKVNYQAKEILKEIYISNTKEDALFQYKRFISLYNDKYPKACDSLKNYEDKLFTFYEFPARHWTHIRTTNVIESVFSTVRLRTNKTRGCGTRIATLAMVFKLIKEAEKKWSKIKGYNYIKKIISGISFKNGVEEIRKAA